MQNLNVLHLNAFRWKQISILGGRIVAFMFVIFAINNWATAIGIWDPTIRFDTMETHWKVAIVFLVVAQPVTAVGLWGHYGWGLVVWGLVAIAELIMHLLYPGLFGSNIGIVYFHIGCAAFFAVTFLVGQMEARKAQ